MINAYISGNRITSNSESAFSLYEKSAFGEKISGKVEYIPSEALFLQEKGILNISSGKKVLSFNETIKKLKKLDKNVETKFIVYSDLRNKGYIPKTALKFGADFRVYGKGSRPKAAHAPWLLTIALASQPLKWHDFSSRIRISHSTKKKLLIAVIDEESSISYYQAEWFKP